MYSYVSYAIATKPWWHGYAGRVKHVVALELTAARAGPHDGGVGKAVDAPGGPEVGKQRNQRNHDKIRLLSQGLASNR